MKVRSRPIRGSSNWRKSQRNFRGCSPACPVCHPEITMKRPAMRDLRALTVEEDLDAIDRMDWRDVFHAGGIDHADPWWRECDVCGSDVTYDTCECLDALARRVNEPLRVPLAILARVA
jgi:hypothetical protein